MTIETMPETIGNESSVAVSIRAAESADAAAISALVTANVGLGHLLPRTADEIANHVSRFLVAARNDHVVGCGELAPLGPKLEIGRAHV